MNICTVPDKRNFKRRSNTAMDPAAEPINTAEQHKLRTTNERHRAQKALLLIVTAGYRQTVRYCLSSGLTERSRCETEYNVAAARTSGQDGNGGLILELSGRLTPRAVAQPLPAAVRLPACQSSAAPPGENLCPGAVQAEPWSICRFFSPWGWAK
ncbi:hypothetical protein CIB48_g11954 [Xylaria polymorpha]|nr:hypothetical protein CIB48_g11954 [Xylaria polymorpha]